MSDENAKLEHVIDFRAPLGLSVMQGLSADQSIAHGTRMTNFFSYDGLLQPAWQYVSGYDVLFTIEHNLTSTTNSNAQAVRKILTTTGGIACVVTTREIFVKDSAGAWQNATPTYTTGTARCLTSTTVTGTGTTWAAQKIQPGDLINFPTISSAWYMVSSVGGDTNITLTATGPNTVGYVTYAIRRVLQGNAQLTAGTGFGNGHKNEIHAIMFNQNLYVAGNNLAGGQPGIIKVTNCIAPATVSPGTYLLSAGGAVYAGMPTGAQISTITKIVGLQSDQSGRLIIPVYEQSGGVPTYNRIRWNDLQNDDEWLTSPAGFTDLVGASARGILTGLGRVGSAYSAHFSYGIVAGVPTGDDAVPYDWRDVPSIAGAAASTFLTQSPRGDVYLGSDGNVWEFTGDTPRRLAPKDDTVSAMFTTVGQYDDQSPSVRTLTHSLTCCAHDSVTDSYHLFLNWYNATNDIGCYHMQVQLDSGAFYAHEYVSPVTAMSTLPGQKRGLYFGGATADQSGSGFAQVAPSFHLCGCKLADFPASAPLNMLQPVDLLQSNDSRLMETSFSTGWIDFGAPSWLKRFDEVEVWYVPKAASPVLTDAVEVTLESRPLNIYPSYSTTFPDPNYQSYSIPQYKLVAPKIQPLPVMVFRFRFDESVASEQPKAGSHFRLNFSGFPGGLCQMVFRATAVGPLSAVDS